MKTLHPLKTLIAATMIQGCVPIFGPTYRPTVVPQEDHLPKPNTAHYGLDAICYRTITDSRERIINCINTKAETEPLVKIQNIIKERLGIDLEIQEINNQSNVFRISNIQEEKKSEVLTLVKNSGYHALYESNSSNIIFY